MKSIFLVLIILCAKPSPPNYLIPIRLKGKVGFISEKGSIITDAKFRNVGEFSEGLIAVREHGTYGYIDRTGSYVIEPQFDYATSFKEGLAVVYKNGKPYYIDKKGEIPFLVHYAFLSNFSGGRAPVKTHSKKIGVIDKRGNLIIDTIFKSMDEFKDGLSIVESLRHNPYDDDEEIFLETGVIDTLGNFVVPFGAYTNISNFNEGYFTARLPRDSSDDDNRYDVIDRNGNIIFKTDKHLNFSLGEKVNCGLATVYIKSNNILDDNSSPDTYQGFINMEGKIIFNDPRIRMVKSYSENRAFVGLEYTKNFLIDQHGKRVGNEYYQDVKDEGFQNGIALVKVNDKWGIINNKAHWIKAPVYSDLKRISHDSKYLAFALEDKMEDQYTREKWGIMKKKNGKIIRDTFAGYICCFVDSGNYFICQIDSMTNYLHENLESFYPQNWIDESPDLTKLSFLNLDSKGRASCYAYSLPDRKKSGGWAKSKNIPKPIENSFADCTKNNLCLHVDEVCTDTIQQMIWGRRLYLQNYSSDSIQFSAQDSRLYISLQALNTEKLWVDVEYFPSSFCGNSYHTVWLNSGYYWSFHVPCYEGDIKTKMRYRVQYLNPKDQSRSYWEKEVFEIFSNEFDGSVNPGQFWKKGIYRTQGFMDPYFD